MVEAVEDRIVGTELPRLDSAGEEGEGDAAEEKAASARSGKAPNGGNSTRRRRLRGGQHGVARVRPDPEKGEGKG